MRSFKYAVCLLGACAVATVSNAQTIREEVARPDIKVQMDAISTGALVTFLMRDVMKVPYVIAPEVLTDRKPVSINLVIPPSEVPVRVVRFLRGIGLDVTLSGGTVYVSKGRRQGGALGPVGSPGGLLPGQIPPDQVQAARAGAVSAAAIGGSPPPLGYDPPPIAEPLQTTVAVVRLVHRKPGEFVEVLRAAVPDVETSVRTSSDVVNGSILGPDSSDFIVLSGPEDAVQLGALLLEELDTPVANVRVEAIVLEIAERKERGSTLSIVGDLFGDALGLRSFAGTGGANPQSLALSAGGLSAMLSVIKEDGRFQIIAEPTVSVRSGSSARLVSGADVPTLGAITIAEEGQLVRSVVYRQSGLTLEVRPTVTGAGVELDVSQERSSFGRTNTGVNDSPTLNQASVRSTALVQPGEVLAIAALEQAQTDDTRSGILPGILGSRRKSSSRSQLLVLIEAKPQPLPLVEKATSVTFIKKSFLGETENDVPRSRLEQHSAEQGEEVTAGRNEVEEPVGLDFLDRPLASN